MSRLVLVTDSTSDLPPAVAQEFGIAVARCRFAFPDHSFLDGQLSAPALYDRMLADQAAPAPFGAAEVAFRKIFDEVLAAGDEPVCIVAPFDVNPSFTTALAAMLSIDNAGIKVLNAGVSSAGLCSLLVALATGIGAGWDRTRLLDEVDRLGPECDTLFVPGDLQWLEASGRLGMIEEKLGDLDGGIPVVRAGNRLTGVEVGDNHDRAVELAAARVGARAPEGHPLVVTIDHAINPASAARAEAAMRAKWNVARVITTELSATYGSQFGPGSVGIGVAPAIL